MKIEIFLIAVVFLFGLYTLLELVGKAAVVLWFKYKHLLKTPPSAGNNEISPEEMVRRMTKRNEEPTRTEAEIVADLFASSNPKDDRIVVKAMTVREVVEHVVKDDWNVVRKTLEAPPGSILNINHYLTLSIPREDVLRILEPQINKPMKDIKR